jgi:integrase/recombinase XerD
MVPSVPRDMTLSRPEFGSLQPRSEGDVIPSHNERQHLAGGVTTLASPHAPAWAAHIPGPHDPMPAPVAKWLEDLAVVRNRPQTTVRAYRQAVAKFVAYLSTLVDLRSPDLLEGVDRSVLRRYQIELANVNPSPRTRNRDLVALRRFLSFAYDEGWTDKELSRQVTLPRFVTGDPHPLRTEDVPKLLAALPTRTLRDHRDRALINLLVSSGCRIAEALALDRADVKREGFRVLGKGGKHRSVYLTDDAFRAVEDYLRNRGPDLSPALFISVAYADRPAGVTLHDNRLTADGARRAFTALRGRVSGDRELFRIFSALRSPHVARHTAATTLLEATNGDVRLVQEVLGHATLSTLSVYTQVTDRRKRVAYRRLSVYLSEVARGGHRDG